MQQEVEGFGAQPGKEVTGGRGESNYIMTHTDIFKHLFTTKGKIHLSYEKWTPHLLFFCSFSCCFPD